MLIGVIGLGFVGLTLSVCIASRGFKVVGVDIDKYKVESILKATPPFYEPKIEELLKQTLRENLVVTTNYNLLAEAQIVFVTVDVPTTEDGKQDLSSLLNAVNSLLKVWGKSSEERLLVIRSTVLPGTSRYIENIVKSENRNIKVAYNPEFLREGKAVEDIFNPSRIIIGVADRRAADILYRFWASFYEHSNSVPPILILTFEEAELAKYASNAFLALRVSFANTIANICQATKCCDTLKVLYAAGLDPRIGTSYLRPGIGYGGYCLPKDIRALITYARVNGYEPILLDAVEKVNERQLKHVVEVLKEELGNIDGKKVAVLGLSFKAGTSDTRNSRAIELAKQLILLGATVLTHDPVVKASDLPPEIRETFTSDLRSIIRNADAVVIATEWDIYRALPNLIKDVRKEALLVIDARRILSLEEVEQTSNVRFRAIGLSKGYRDVCSVSIEKAKNPIGVLHE